MQKACMAVVSVFLLMIIASTAVMALSSLPDIKIIIYSPQDVEECISFNYTIKYTNAGTGNATNVTLKVLLPLGFCYTNGTSSVNGTALEPSVVNGSLVWNLSEAGYQNLTPGSFLEVRFNLTAGCSSPAEASINATTEYQDDSGGYHTSQGNGTLIRILRPSLIVEKTPSTQKAKVGDTVSWTITVKNAGLAEASNVTLVDSPGPGLNVTSFSPPPDGWINGKPFWTNISLGVDETFQVNESAQVIHCSGLTNKVFAYSTCPCGSTCHNTSALASIELILEDPDVKVTSMSVSPSPVSPCIPSTVEINLTNQGSGGAYRFNLTLTLPPGLSYAGGGVPTPEVSGNKLKFSLGDLPPGSSATITFNVTSSCGSSGTKYILMSPQYLDRCDNLWRPPVRYLSVNSGSPSLSITKTGSHEILNSSKANYTIEIQSNGLSLCRSPRVVVKDELPSFLNLTNAFPYPNSTSGGLLTWNLTANSSMVIKIEVAPTPNSSCGMWGLNKANATLCCCQSCSPSGQNSVSIREVCSTGASCFMIRSFSNASSVEPCRYISYSSNIIFRIGSINSTLSNMIYTHCAFETGDLKENYVQNSTFVVLPNGTKVKLNPVKENATCIVWNLSKLNFLTESGKNLTINYTLRVTCWAGGYIHDRMGFRMNGTFSNGTLAGCSGYERWAKYIGVSRPLLSITEDHPPFTPVGSNVTRKIKITGATASSPAYNVTVESFIPKGFVRTSNATFDFGWTKVSNVEPFIEGNKLIWNRTNLGILSEVSSSFTVEYNMTSLCNTTSGFHYISSVNYSDRCAFVKACDPGCTCVHSATYDSGPMKIVRPQLVVKLTPERIYTVGNVVEWDIHVANVGNGSASVAKVKDVLGPGLVYNGSVLPAGWNVSVSGREITFHNQSYRFDAGAHVDIELRAKMVACSGLTNNVTAEWFSCPLGSCTACESVNSSSDVIVPDGKLMATDHIRPSGVCMCTQTNVTITLKNAGPVNVYNASVNYSLPGCFHYNSSVQAYALNSTYRTPISPQSYALDGSWVLWNLTGTPFSVMKVDEVVNITFNATAGCCISGGGYSEMIVNYDKPCCEPAPQVLHRGVALYGFKGPDLSLSAPSKICGEPGEVRWWNLTLINQGSTEARWVNVTVVLPPQANFISSSPPPDQQSGRVLTWYTQRKGGSVPDISPGGSFKIGIKVSVIGCVDEGYLHVNLVDGCEWCVAENEWYNHTTYLHSSPLSPAISVIHHEIGACENATWKFRVRNRDSCLRLRTGYSNVLGGLMANYTFYDNLTSDVSPVYPLDKNSVMVYHVESTNTDIRVPVLSYGSSPPPGATMFAWVRSLNGGIEWMVFNATDSFRPEDYFDISYNVTTSTCALARHVHRISTYNLQDSCGNSRDRSITVRDRVLIPKLVPEKIPSYQYADINETVSWTVRVSNQGNGTAHNVTIRDVMTSNLQYLSASPPPDNVAGIVDGVTELTWTNISISPGGSFSYTISANVTACPPPEIRNNVTTYWGCDSLCTSPPVKATAVVLACGVPAPIEKHPHKFDVCGNQTIEISLHNRGASMYGVCFNESLPFGLEPMDVTPNGNITANFSITGGASYTNVPSNRTVVVQGKRIIIWNLTNVVVREGDNMTMSFRVHTNCSLQSSQEVLNLTYWDVCNRRHSNLTTFPVTPLRPDLSQSTLVKISPSDGLDRWRLVVWDLVIKNTGDGKLYFLNITDVLGPGLELVDVNLTPTSISGNVIRWNFSLVNDPLEPGEQMAIRIRANVTGCAPEFWDNASLRWGCDGIFCCTTPLWVNSSFNRAIPEVTVHNLFDGGMNVCEEEVIKFTVVNSGGATIYGSNSSMPVMFGYELPHPSCISYLPGSTNITLPNGTVLHLDPLITRSSVLNLTWTFDHLSMEPGSKIEVSFKVKGGCCLTSGGSTRAYASGWGPCGMNAVDDDAVALGHVNRPHISLDKTPAKQVKDRWSLVSWVVEIRNDGNATAHNVNVTDVLEGLTYVSGNLSSYRASSSSDRVVWNLTSLPAGSVIHVNVTANVTSCGPKEDKVYASWGCGSICQRAESPPAVVNLTYPNATLTMVPVNGTCPLSPEPGDYLTFVLTVSNLPPNGIAYTPLLRVKLPYFLQYVNSTGGSYSSNGSYITWNLSPLRGTIQERFTVMVKALTPNGTVGIINATLNYTDACGNKANPITGALYYDNDSCKVVIRAPIWYVKKLFSPSTASECDTVEVLAHFAANRGKGHMYDVQLVDNLPKSLSYVPGSTVIKNGTTGEIISTADPIISGHTLRWPLNVTLNPEQDIELIFKVRIKCGAGKVVNVVWIEGKDGAGGFNKSSGEAILRVTSAKIKLKKFIGAQRLPIGSTVKVYIEVDNLGNRTTNVVLTDHLPSGMTYIKGSTRLSGAAFSDPAIGEGTLTWVLHRVRPGQSLLLEFEVNLTKVGVLVDTASARWACSCGPAESSASITVVKRKVIPPTPPPTPPTPPTPPSPKNKTIPIIIVTKTATPEVVRKGQSVLFQIKVCNIGNGTAYNLSVIDLLPKGLQAEGPTDWRVTLTPGECVKLSLKAKVTAVKGDLVNVVKVDNTSATVVVHVKPVYIPNLTVSKACQTRVHAGNNTAFSITVRNIGNGTYNGTAVDVLPSGWRYVPGSASINGTPSEPSINGRTLSWRISLLPGAHLTIRYSATVQGQGCNVFRVDHREARCCTGVSLQVPAAGLVLLMFLFFPLLRRKPVILDYGSARSIIQAVGMEKFAKRGDMRVTRRTASELLADPDVSARFRYLMDTGVVKVHDLTDEEKELARSLSHEFKVDPGEAETIVLAKKMGSPAVLSDDAAMELASRASLDVKTPREMFAKEALKRRFSLPS